MIVTNSVYLVACCVLMLIVHSAVVSQQMLWCSCSCCISYGWCRGIAVIRCVESTKLPYSRPS